MTEYNPSKVLKAIGVAVLIVLAFAIIYINIEDDIRLNCPTEKVCYRITGYTLSGNVVNRVRCNSDYDYYLIESLNITQECKPVFGERVYE